MSIVFKKTIERTMDFEEFCREFGGNQSFDEIAKCKKAWDRLLIKYGRKIETSTSIYDDDLLNQNIMNLSFGKKCKRCDKEYFDNVSSSTFCDECMAHMVNHILTNKMNA
jgi:hypothetical protein